MKIYTKTGDKGTTSLLGGTRVSKYSLRINSYGTIDELNSHIGLLRSYPIEQEDISFLISIQNILFTIGSNLADDTKDNKFNLPTVSENDVAQLELAMDEMNKNLPDLTSFILPGGHLAVSQSHICRCVCRRAERNVVQLNETIETNPLIVKYLNRLSDYFFTLSRKLNVVFNVEEIPWVSS